MPVQMSHPLNIITSSRVDFPREEDLVALPPLALTGLTVRAVRMMLPEVCLKQVYQYLVRDMEKVLCAIEKFTTSGVLPSNISKLADMASNIHDIAYSESRVLWDLATEKAELATKAASFYYLAVAGQLISYLASNLKVAEKITQANIETLSSMFSLRFPPESVESFIEEFKESFHLVTIEASANQWREDFALPNTFFGFNSRFDTKSKSNYSIIVEPISIIHTHMVNHLKDNPRDLLALSPYEFEQLIAGLFEGFGFKVELTARTRDKGRDIIAIDYRDQRKYLIECKRYKTRKVDIGLVQRLHGVVHGENATKGILATTSSFTSPAKEFLENEMVKWRLEGKDFDGIAQWLDQYQKFMLARKLVPFIIDI